MHNLKDTQTVLNTLIEDILEIAQQYPELPNTRDAFNPVQAQFRNAYHKSPTLLNEQDNLTLSNLEIGRILSWDHSQHTIGQLIDFIINQLKQHTPLKDNPNFQNYAYSGEKYQDDLTEPSPFYKKILSEIQETYSNLYELYATDRNIDLFRGLFQSFINKFTDKNHTNTFLNNNNIDAHINLIFLYANNERDAFNERDEFYELNDKFMKTIPAYANLRKHFELKHFVEESAFCDVESVTLGECLLSQASFFNPPNYFIVSGSIGATFGIVATLAYTIFALNPVFLTAMGVGLVTFLLASVCTEMYMQATAPTARI